MKVHFKLRWLPALSLAFVLAFTLSSPLKADAAGVNMQNGMPPDGVTIGTDGNPSPTIVSFGGKQWDVIGYDGDGVASAADTMTLLLANGQRYGETAFDYSNTVNEYSGSDLQSAMDSYAGSITGKEASLITTRDLPGGGGNYGDAGYDADLIAGPDVTGAKFWPLSVGEAGLLNQGVCNVSASWWLRSPSYGQGSIYGVCAAYVDAGGYINESGAPVGGYSNEVRPAFILDLATMPVLFSSASVDSGSGAGPYIRSKADAAPGGGLLDVAATNEAPGVPIKFTFLDPSMATPTLALAGTTNGTSSISFGYSGAATGTKQYLSCVLEQSGVVKYYGKLADCADASAANGIFILPTGNGTVPGTYDLKLFCEQANDTYDASDATGHDFSDFAGAPVGSMTLTVDADGNGTVGGTGFSTDNTTPTLTPGAVSRTSDANATVKFTSSEAGWYMWVLDSATTSPALIPLTTAEQTITFDSLTSLTAGPHTLMIGAWDAAGNTSDILTVNIPAYQGDSLQAVLDMIDSLPDTVVTWADADKLAAATNAFEALSNTDLIQMQQDYQDYIDRLYTAQAQAMPVNERDGNVSVSGDLPWNVRIEATPPAASGSLYNTFLGKLGGKKLLALYDIKLIDILTGDEYILPDGMTVTVTIDKLPLTGEKNVIIAHEKGAGVEYITGSVNGNKISFSAASFSLYGVAADQTSEGGNGGNGNNNNNGGSSGNGNNGNAGTSVSSAGSPQTGDSSNAGSLWIMLLASAGLITAALSMKPFRKRRKV